MGKHTPILLILSALMVVSVSSQQTSLAQQPVQPNVVPLRTISKLSIDKRYETVSGDPAKAGSPFVTPSNLGGSSGGFPLARRRRLCLRRKK
jgi:hypothetical protein